MSEATYRNVRSKQIKGVQVLQIGNGGREICLCWSVGGIVCCVVSGWCCPARTSSQVFHQANHSQQAGHAYKSIKQISYLISITATSSPSLTNWLPNLDMWQVLLQWCSARSSADGLCYSQRWSWSGGWSQRGPRAFLRMTELEAIKIPRRPLSQRNDTQKGTSIDVLWDGDEGIPYGKSP